METIKFKSRVLWFGLALAAMGVLSQLPAEEILTLSPLRCPLHTFLGIRCPTCGLGHSLAFAITGQWARAWDAHILGPPVLGLGLGLLTAWAFSKTPRTSK